MSDAKNAHYNKKKNEALDKDTLAGDMYQDKYVRLRLSTCEKFLRPYLRNGVKILDIGCYTADLLRLIRPSCKVEYYGIDYFEPAIKIAKARGAKVLKIDLDCEQIPLTEKFDIIIANEILEHLKHAENVIHQIKVLLKKNGVVLVTIPNECTLYHRFRALLGKSQDRTGFFEPYYHLHFPTIRQSEEFAEKYFETIKKEYYVYLIGFMDKVGISFWRALARIRPSLFARGIILLCKQKE